MAKSTRKLNLAILDDDQSVLRLVKAYLEAEFKEQATIYTLEDPHQAQTFLDERCCDLLLSDIEMPGLDGLEVLAFAKKRNPWTQVIFMTGCSTWDRISTAIERGATDYLTKPINREQLVKTIHYQIDRLLRWRQAAMESMRLKREEAKAVEVPV